MSSESVDQDYQVNRTDLRKAIEQADGAAESALRALYRDQFDEDPEVSD